MGNKFSTEEIVNTVLEGNDGFNTKSHPGAADHDGQVGCND